jgi:hypothetical protein
VTRQDISNLLTFCADPDDDDALLVPQLGRPRSSSDAEQPQPPLHLPAVATTPGRGAAGSGGSRGAGSMLAVQTAAAEDDDGSEVRSRWQGCAARRC